MLSSLRRLTRQRIGRNIQIHNSRPRNFHKDYDAVREEQSFKLSDGRTMGFAEYGKPGGVPAFCLHGSPGSRYDGLGFDELAKKLNVRIICPDRPGHGLSTFQPNRRLLDYPNDITQLAKHLDIAKYHCFGISGGGPYVVACAHGLPKDELLNAAVIAGIGPPEAITLKLAGLYTVLALSLMKWTPGLIRLFVNWAVSNDKRLQKQLNASWKYVVDDPEDKARLLSPESQPYLMATMKAAYTQGADGVIRDGQIYGSPWGFALSDVQKEIMLFYGHKDGRTPIEFGRYYKKHLPNAELFEYDDASHFNMEKYDEEILARLIGHEHSTDTP